MSEQNAIVIQEENLNQVEFIEKFFHKFPVHLKNLSKYYDFENSSSHVKNELADLVGKYFAESIIEKKSNLKYLNPYSINDLNNGIKNITLFSAYLEPSSISVMLSRFLQQLETKQNVFTLAQNNEKPYAVSKFFLTQIKNSFNKTLNESQMTVSQVTQRKAEIEKTLSQHVFANYEKEPKLYESNNFQNMVYEKEVPGRVYPDDIIKLKDLLIDEYFLTDLYFRLQTHKDLNYTAQYFDIHEKEVATQQKVCEVVAEYFVEELFIAYHQLPASEKNTAGEKNNDKNNDKVIALLSEKTTRLSSFPLSLDSSCFYYLLNGFKRSLEAQENVFTEKTSKGIQLTKNAAEAIRKAFSEVIMNSQLSAEEKNKQEDVSMNMFLSERFYTMSALSKPDILNIRKKMIEMDIANLSKRL